MKNIRLTKIFTFEAAHALYGYDGKCKNIHGHSYCLHVTILGTPIEDGGNAKNGMVIDFGDLKKIVNENIITPLDHTLVLNKNSPHITLVESLKKWDYKILLVPYQPTCENMLLDFVSTLQEKLPASVKLVSLRLYETQTSYSEWLLTDN